MASLRDLRLLTARQVERLHFQEGSPLTQSRRCRRTLHRLYELNLVHRLERRIGGIHAGSSGFIYGLSGWGQRLTGAPGPAGGTRRRRPWEPSAAFQDHILAVSELGVQLHEATRAGQLELLEFTAEPACWRSFAGLAGEQLLLKPDAFVHVASGDFEHLSFIEVDRSTEGLAVIRRKGVSYRDFWQRGGEQQRHGVFPQVVFLTLDDQRAAAIQRVLRQVETAEGLFVITTFDQALPVLSGGRP